MRHIVKNYRFVQSYLSPGGPLHSIMEPRSTRESHIDIVLCSHKNNLLACTKAPLMTSIRLEDVAHSERLPDIKCLSGTVIKASCDGRFVCAAREGELCTYDIEQAGLHSEVALSGSKIAELTVSKTIAAVAFKNDKGPTIVDIENGKILKILEFQARSVLASSDDMWLATNTGHTLVIYNLQLLELRLVVEMNSLPDKLLFSPDAHALFFLHKKRTLQKSRLGVTSSSQKGGNGDSSDATVGMMNEGTIVDFHVSHAGDKLVVTSQLRLYVFDARTEKSLATIVHAPEGFTVC